MKRCRVWEKHTVQCELLFDVHGRAILVAIGGSLFYCGNWKANRITLGLKKSRKRKDRP